MKKIFVGDKKVFQKHHKLSESKFSELGEKEKICEVMQLYKKQKDPQNICSRNIGYFLNTYRLTFSETILFGVLITNIPGLLLKSIRPFFNKIDEIFIFLLPTNNIEIIGSTRNIIIGLLFYIAIPTIFVLCLTPPVIFQIRQYKLGNFLYYAVWIFAFFAALFNISMDIASLNNF